MSRDLSLQGQGKRFHYQVGIVIISTLSEVASVQKINLIFLLTNTA